MLNIFNQSCRGPRWGVAKTRIVHTAAAIVCGLDIEETVRCVHKPKNADLAKYAKYAPAYLEQSVRTRARTLVSLKQASFLTARAFTEASGVQKLQKLGMLPKLRKRQCWKCGRVLLRAGQMLRCGRCSVKYDRNPKPKNHSEKALSLNTAPKLMMMLRMTLLLMRVMTMMIPLSLCSTGRVGGETTRTEAQRNLA